MNNSATNNFISKITLLLLVLVYSSTYHTVMGQCPANPVGGTPNLVTSSMPAEVYFCEEMSSILLDPNISTPSTNFRWYKFNANTKYWDALFIFSSSLKLYNSKVDTGRYAVCWQQGNTGNYSSDEIEVKEKVFLDELTAANEFKLPNNANEVFVCSNQITNTFDNAGNRDYQYAWKVPSNFGLSNVNIKNPTFTLPSNSYSIVAKGSGNTAVFNIPLTITDKKNGCVAQQSVSLRLYPFLGPEFANLPDEICQNKPLAPEVRVFMVNGYKIQSATVQVGADPTVTYYEGTDFVFTNAKDLQPTANTLGKGDIPLALSAQAQVLKFPLVTSQIESFPVYFNMLTEKGCKGSITKWVTVTNCDLTATDKSLNIDNSSALILYPNPTNELLHISTEVKLRLINIYHTLGNKILTTTEIQSINVATLAPGLYLLEAISSDDRRILRKFEVK